MGLRNMSNLFCICLRTCCFSTGVLGRLRTDKRKTTETQKTQKCRIFQNLRNNLFCRIADFVFVPELKICKNGWFRKTAAVFWLRRVCKKCGVDVFSIIGELKTHMFGRFWNILFWGICKICRFVVFCVEFATTPPGKCKFVGCAEYAKLVLRMFEEMLSFRLNFSVAWESQKCKTTETQKHRNAELAKFALKFYSQFNFCRIADFVCGSFSKLVVFGKFA